MKMKNLFVLLAAITLVACSSNASKLPSSSLEDDSSSSSSSVETTSESSNATTSTSNNTGTSSNNTGTSSNHAGTSSNGGGSSSEPEDGAKKKTVTFYTRQGHARYLIFDRKGLLYKVMIANCTNRLTKEEFHQKYPKVKL